MKRIISIALLTVLLLSNSERSFAWGKKGHELVAEIAFHFLDDSTKKIVKDFLGKMSIEEAANWMDDERSNSYYNYMRTWHYVDMERGEKYQPTSEKNALTILHSAIVELRQYKNLKRKDVKRDLLLIFHLVGDLHQPLHCGYTSDKGGNMIDVTSPVVSGNLHSIWDTQILEYKGITLDTCLVTYNSMAPAEIDGIKKINELKWMYDSRSLLDTVYNFQNKYLDRDYVDRNAQVIKRQLVIGGLRLASLLTELFSPDAKKAD